MKQLTLFVIAPIVLAGCHYNRFCMVGAAPVATPQPAYDNGIYGAYAPEPAPVVAQPAPQPVVIPAAAPVPARAAAVKKPAVKKAAAVPVKKKKVARPKPKPVAAAAETCPPADEASEAIFIKRVRTLPDGTQQVINEFQEYVPKK